MYSAQQWLVASNAQLAVQSSNCLTESGTTAGSPLTIEVRQRRLPALERSSAAGRIADEIVSTASGLCVTVPPGTTASGTQPGPWHVLDRRTHHTWRVGYAT